MDEPITPDARRPGRRRHRPAGRLAAALLLGFVVAIAAAGCTVIGRDPSTHGPTAAPGGLSREVAIARARSATPGAASSTTVVRASVESDPFSPHGSAPPGPLVWVIRLRGGLTPSPCPSGFLDVPPAASGAPCLDGEGGIDVVIDYYTGTVLGWSH